MRQEDTGLCLDSWMNALQEPIRRDFSTDPLRPRLRINHIPDRRELNPQSDIVDEAGRLLRRFPPLDLPTYDIFELWGAQPKGRPGSRRRRSLSCSQVVHGIMRRDSLIPESGDVVFRREVARVNRQAIRFADRFLAPFAVFHAGEMDPRAHP